MCSIIKKIIRYIAFKANCIKTMLFLVCKQRPPEKLLYVIIPSYNNSQWYTKNLDSVFKQKYTNYHVIYIDDCSTDTTAALVQTYIKKNNYDHKITFIRNEVNKGATANRYTGSHLAPDNAIVMILDGDDWFAHKYVMQYINYIYTTTHCWLTYGQFVRWPSYEWGHCKWLPQEYDFTQMDQWYISHLRTYYAWLFKRIKKEAFLENGTFYTVAGDAAETLPMLLEARGHIFYNATTLYVYNQATPLNDFKIRQKEQLIKFNDIQRRYRSS